MAVVSMKQLLEAGVHFGHQTRRWNPKMAPYIFTERNGIYIIDLQKTVKKLDEAYNFVRDVAAEGGSILFVGTKKQAQESIREEATRCGMHYVNARWLGGMLTNFKTCLLYTSAQSLGLFDAGNHPEGMAEQVAVFFIGIRIVAVRVIFCDQVQKAPDITFVDKIANLCSSWHSLMIVFDIPSPNTEKFPEIERLVLQLYIAFIGEDFAQVVGIDFQLRQLVVGVGIAKVQLVPFRFALLLHHIIPGINVVVKFFEDIEPVSYTHLDVYKRQVSARLPEYTGKKPINRKIR